MIGVESLKQKVLKYLSNVEKEKEYSTYGKYMIGVESDLVFFTLAFFFFSNKRIFYLWKVHVRIA